MLLVNSQNDLTSHYINNAMTQIVKLWYHINANTWPKHITELEA